MGRIFALEPVKFGLAKQRADITTQSRNDRINLKRVIEFTIISLERTVVIVLLTKKKKIDR